MALALKRLPGPELTFTITGGGTVAAIRSLSISRTQGTFDGTAASAEYDQKVLGRKNLTGSYELFLGTEGVPPSEGDEITVLSVAVGADEVTDPDIDSGTVYGDLRVTGVDETYGTDLATATVKFEGGFIQ